MTETQPTLRNRWTGLSQNARGFSFIAVGTLLLIAGVITSLSLSPSRSSTNVYASGAGSAATSTITSTTSAYRSSSTASTSTASTVRLTTTSQLITTTTQLVSDPSDLASGWVARLGSSQPGVPREVSDITNLLTQVRARYPNAAVYLTDALGGRSTLRPGYLVLLVGSYPDRSSAVAVCAQLSSSLKPYGCDVDYIS